MVNYNSVIEYHLKGKIGIHYTKKLDNKEDLSMVYTPRVAEISEMIIEDPAKVYDLTIKGNTVAVVTNGSAVLGLGNIKPLAALPVMEGKCMIFKKFAGIDAFPICLQNNNVDSMIHSIFSISPTFGAICLEDIKAPECFELTQELSKILNIPILHDDQHGTSVVIGAGLINSLKIFKKRKEDIKIVVSGAGAGGIATTKLLIEMGMGGMSNINKNSQNGNEGKGDIILFDSHGSLHKDRYYGNNQYKEFMSTITNKENFTGNIQEALENADVFIGLSKRNALTNNNKESFKIIDSMNSNPIIFACANPDPEIPVSSLKSLKEEKGDDIIIATGRSDLPNQINNALAFPGIFRGLLDSRCFNVTINEIIAATKALTKIDTKLLSPNYIIPTLFNPNVVAKVARYVIESIIKDVSFKEYEEMLFLPGRDPRAAG